MGPVLCCVDDSDGARRALDVAQQLSTRLDVELVLVHVEPSPASAPGVSAAVAGQERLMEEELRDARALLDGVAREAGVGEEVRRRVAVGPAAARIVEACEEEGAYLVVVGSRGRGGLGSALLGSVSSEVASKAPCPCVVVPPSAARRRQAR